MKSTYLECMSLQYTSFLNESFPNIEIQLLAEKQNLIKVSQNFLRSASDTQLPQNVSPLNYHEIKMLEMHIHDHNSKINNLNTEIQKDIDEFRFKIDRMKAMRNVLQREYKSHDSSIKSIRSSIEVKKERMNRLIMNEEMKNKAIEKIQYVWNNLKIDDKLPYEP